tara:strand:- start:74 stop:337 length:264 start_codon:yes stop_codon:yes gene_type:complete
MREEIKHAVIAVKHGVEVASHNPNTAWWVVCITWLQTWWIDFGSELTDAITSGLSIVLLIVLIRMHLHKTSQLIKENKKSDGEPGNK